MRFLVTAGPTREFLDPVRFLSNRSTGKMGYAIASAAQADGHEVRLISGPVALAAPEGVQVIPVVSAEDMLAAVLANVDWCEALVMSAAVADWRPEFQSPTKLKKADMSASLRLTATPDILTSIRPCKADRVFVGFAAETGDARDEALRKLRKKGLDAIIANDVLLPGAGFEVDTNDVWVLTADGREEHWTLQPKAELGRRIVSLIVALTRPRDQGRLPGSARSR